MSKKNNNKKSTTKHRKFDTSKIIPIIAIIEVVILVAVTTMAWFFFNANKSLSSGIITVQADSGLEIDFQDADKSTYIDIFDHIDKDEFNFEPATSVDGRNIYFPTSGTFGTTDTEGMVFRDGTVNDINSKYINIDFELTNTHDEDAVEVYLSHNSFFHIKENNKTVNGKALRMALYNNDGNSGNVASNLISNIKKTAATEPVVETQPATDSEGKPITYYEDFTVYFNNTENWSDIKAYVWHNTVVDSYITKWPGDSMVNVSGNLYSYSFSNPYTLNGNNKVYYYDSIVFNNGSGTQTVDINNLSKDTIYSLGSKSGEKYEVTSTQLALNTVYFLKPTDWAVPACLTSNSNIESDSNAHNMTQVTTGIYSYTFPNTDTYIRFIDKDSSGNNTGKNSLSTSVVDKKLYYFPMDGPSGNVYTVNYSTSSIYFYNTLNWEQPYAFVNGFADVVGKYTYSIPMIALSGNLYYCSLSTAYLQDVVEKATDTYDHGTGDPRVDDGRDIDVNSLANNCQVYFGNASSDPSEKTSLTYDNGAPVYCKSEYVYTPSSTSGENGYYLKSATSYSDEVDVTADSYAVISPGVSAGFQRPANPVNKINYTTGAVESIVPTFASSFDDYLIGSKNPVFTIGPKQTVNMSMIIWLEGTDAHCTAENYAGKDINLLLEFSTFLAGDTVDGTYTYHFVDSTEQVWTSDTITNPATGVTVSPVMQLYDKDADRGYLMSPESYTTYAGKRKVKVWRCTAPQSLVNDSDDKHNLEFRRVNPYDESEVWNRWDAGVGSDFYDYSYSSATRTVSFTAFADGSPERDYYENGRIGDHSLPTLSCGGLWGTFATEILTVYDGRKDRNIDTLSFGYTYTYPAVSGKPSKSVTIEYKASGYRNLAADSANNYNSQTWFTNFYSIVIPSDIFQKGSNAYFVDYHNVDNDYAINSDRNQEITLGTKWPAEKVGAIRGRFFEFNEEYDFNNSRNKATTGSDYHSYWGSDVLYVQARSSLSVSYSSNSNEAFVQAKFTGSGSTTCYSYLYENQDYKGSYGYGFIAVVPCEAAYTKYDIVRCKANAHTAVTRDTGFTNNNIASKPADQSDTGCIQNIITDVDSADARIRILDYDYKRIYFTAINWGPNYEKPTLLVKSNSSENHRGEETGKYDNTHNSKIYRYDIRSDSKGQFKTKIDHGNKGAYSIELDADKVKDGIIYYPKDEWSGNDFKMGEYSGSVKELYGNGDGVYHVDEMNKKISSFTQSVGQWPHYVPQQEKG